MSDHTPGPCPTALLSRVTNVYAGALHDRAGQVRLDAETLRARALGPDARFLVMWRGLHLVDDAGLVRFCREDIGAYDDDSCVFLGLSAADAMFALDLSDHTEPPTLPRGTFEDIRPLAASLPEGDAALVAQARGMAHWLRMHRFCGRCGAANLRAEGGHKLVCSAEPKHVAFPRTDPVVIMLVRHAERALLARGTRFPPERRTLSALAGFVEPGESAEEAVAREVHEETGLRVGDICYHSSQPWPFPGSLMLGFTAVARDDALTLDPTEIAEARWLSRADLRARRDEDFTLPGPAAIARRLIHDWLIEDGGPGLF